MLSELARELGQPDIAKSPEDQRIRLLLDALRPAQALLLLDNLESLPKTDRDQLFTFVKRLPPGCKAILTSRRRIGSGSEELILEKLDQDAALAFLRTCPPDNDPLEFIFGDLAKEFTADEEKVLCALTYFSLPAKVEHLAATTRRLRRHTHRAKLALRSADVPQRGQFQKLAVSVAEFGTLHSSHANQSSTGKPLIRENSATLFVATDNPTLRACPAINRS